MLIREYKNTDKQGLITLVIELQEFERQIEPNRVAGKEIGNKAVEEILLDNDGVRGKVFVVEDNTEVVGFISMKVKHESDEYLTTLRDYLYISNLIVTQSYRGKGVGKLLMTQAEEFAKANNLSIINVGVLAANTNTWDFYQNLGYQNYEVNLLKKL